MEFSAKRIMCDLTTVYRDRSIRIYDSYIIVKMTQTPEINVICRAFRDGASCALSNVYPI